MTADTKTDAPSRQDSIQELGDEPSSSPSSHTNNFTLICDMGYGLPREGRPRKEKILAISRQIVNFLEWQMNPTTTTANVSTNDLSSSSSSCKKPSPRPALVQIVGCPDDSTQLALHDRIQQLLGSTKMSNNTIPSHVTISCDSLEDTCAIRNDCSVNDIVYLSPDAPESLIGRPPKVAIVGLLIDRRVQPNRSRDRASNLQITAKRWPLEEYFADLDPNEPLNVDCVLEGMQQWWWNVPLQLEPDDVTEGQNASNDDDDDDNRQIYRKAFVQAAAQAIEHHAQRHPSRPIHLSGNK